MQSLQDKIRGLEETIRELNICNAQIEQLTKERSNVVQNLEYKIFMLHNAVMNLTVFEALRKK